MINNYIARNVNATAPLMAVANEFLAAFVEIQTLAV
jgi:hypothetical protein